ncbi:uncharacterized protein Osi24 isoform X1 [Cloeon dipterum]|uniref:uncharacterized protein Osi24 isoform X1 n=1 Tax=Cloeon dipterum TaxID=197152 RepID=UPI0032203564
MRPLVLLTLLVLAVVRADQVDQLMLAKLHEKCAEKVDWSCLQEQALKSLVEEDEKPITEYVSGYQVHRVEGLHEGSNRSLEDPDQYLVDRTWDYLKGHELVISFSDLESGARTFSNPIEFLARIARTASANTFLTGFGLGFLAFGLKKLLLPFFIGAQVVKSILLAIFLPTILTSIGKFLGKSGASIFQASAGHGHSGGEDEFDFKDNFDPNYDTSATSNVAAFTNYPQNRRDSLLGSPSYVPAGYGSLYGKRPLTQWPFKRPLMPSKFNHFQQVPGHSLIMNGFDPYYSPIVSRLDVVFKQLGYEKKSKECTKRLVCNMYKQPGKYAPYSNLVSAQLSRDLSELQKPVAGGEDSTQFFAYMKAAKDGQEGSDCSALYPDCDSTEDTPEDQSHYQLDGAKSEQSTLFGAASPPMVKTYHEINKLVQARRLAKQLADEKEKDKRADSSAPASA